jgi:hypothetical protein
MIELALRVAAFALGAVLGILIAATSVAQWHSEAINRGYAIHCPDDGRWAWIGECDK